MAMSLPEDKAIYLMNVLKHSDLPKPDFKAIAQETGQSSANNAQKRYKAIIESLGFKLVDNQIVDDSGSTNIQTPTPASTPKGRKAATAKGTSAAKGTPSKRTNGNAKVKTPAKRRRVKEIESESEDDYSENSAQSNQGKRAKTVQPEVKREQEDGGAGAGLNDGDEDDDFEIVSEGTVVGGFRARSITIKPDPMTTDDEDEAN